MSSWKKDVDAENASFSCGPVFQLGSREYPIVGVSASDFDETAEVLTLEEEEFSSSDDGEIIGSVVRNKDVISECQELYAWYLACLKHS